MDKRINNYSKRVDQLYYILVLLLLLLCMYSSSSIDMYILCVYKLYCTHACPADNYFEDQAKKYEERERKRKGAARK